MEETLYLERDAEWEKLAKQVYETRMLRKRYEELEKHLMDKLVFSANKVPARAGCYRLNMHVRTGNVNYKLIPELNGVDLDKYRSAPVEIWQLEQIANLKIEEV